MSKPAELTRHQKMIIDVLADDYENVNEITSALGASISKRQIEDAVWCLIEKGMVDCFHAEKTGMEPVSNPDITKLNEYWFILSQTGELALETLH